MMTRLHLHTVHKHIIWRWVFFYCALKDWIMQWRYATSDVTVKFLHISETTVCTNNASIWGFRGMCKRVWKPCTHFFPVNIVTQPLKFVCGLNFLIRCLNLVSSSTQGESNSWIASSGAKYQTEHGPGEQANTQNNQLLSRQTTSPRCHYKGDN